MCVQDIRIADRYESIVVDVSLSSTQTVSVGGQDNARMYARMAMKHWDNLGGGANFMVVLEASFGGSWITIATIVPQAPHDTVDYDNLGPVLRYPLRIRNAGDGTVDLSVVVNRLTTSLESIERGSK